VLRFITRRIALSGLIVVLAVSLLFGMIHMLPGDPASVILGPRATPELRAELNEKMGLDQPFIVQLGRFLGNVATGDLGEDPFSRREVADIVFEQLPFTLTLVFAAIAGATLLGVPLGCYSAIRRGSWLDRLTAVVSVAFIAVPSFVVALYALMFLSVQLRWFPAIGAGESGNLADQAWHLVLPALALGLGWVGYIARLVRASMLEVLEENHVRTARAFGLPPADRDHPGPRYRDDAVRCAVCRNRVLAPGHRQAVVRVRDDPQLSRRDGLGAGHDGVLRHVHARIRYRQCAAGSAVARK
jgi:peptide/nickel transport system permease protein